MRPTLFRLTLALAAFLCGFHLTNLCDSPRAPRARASSPAAVPPALPQPPSPPARDATAPAAAEEARVVQEEFIYAPGFGRVRVTASEHAGGFARLSFTNAATWEKLFDTPVGSGDAFDPELRFRVIPVDGVAGPLVVALTRDVGGSDSSWEAVAVGVVNGQFEVLTHESMVTSNQGGFYFGDLGGGRGPGAAVWGSVEGEGEGHYGPHRYEVILYAWNPKTSRFEWSQVRRTAGVVSSGRSALRSLGLGFGDIRRSFPDFASDEDVE